MKRHKILFLAPYPQKKAPSQRFRFEHYLPFLEKEGFEYEYHSFLGDNTWKIIYKSGNFFSKILGTIEGFIKRFLLLFRLSKFDFVYIHREVTPLGPPIFEWLIAKVFKMKTIYDFDDAIWIPNTSKANFIAAWLKSHQKVAKICEWSTIVTVGNDFLGDFARKQNRNVIVIPTVVDTEHYHNQIQRQDTSKINIGWTGSHSTLKYIHQVVPTLRLLEKEIDFEFYVIADKKPDIDLKCLRFIPWNKQTEIQDLLNFHIGIMPMTTDDWTAGKCGFKAIQYMALGIPTVVSPVGVNTKIVENDVNGFLCDSPEQWNEKLRILLKNRDLRKELGRNARQSIQKCYSIVATQKQFIDLFKSNEKA